MKLETEGFGGFFIKLSTLEGKMFYFFKSVFHPFTMVLTFLEDVDIYSMSSSPTKNGSGQNDPL